ncbi:MAG: hypothetical protein LUC97_04640 [Clostridiales bacterium]|nr:hypothetical protein [Clostridiales bacterium]
MIYIAAAMAPEAKPFTEGLELKADKTFNKIRVYKNENVTLVITGTGILRAAASISFVLGRLTPKIGDIFLNIGVCGGRNSGVFICRKVSCYGLKGDFYPDMVYNSGFKEAELITYFKPQKNIPESTLADTEGAALASAVRAYFSPDRCFFIKIVSDKGDFSAVTPKTVAALVSECFHPVMEFLGSIPQEEKPPYLTAEELKEAEKFNFTVSQSIMLKNLLTYYRLKGGNPLGLLKSFEAVKTKAEGRTVLERIREYVLQ